MRGCSGISRWHKLKMSAIGWPQAFVSTSDVVDDSGSGDDDDGDDDGSYDADDYVDESHGGRSMGDTFSNRRLHLVQYVTCNAFL